MKPVRVICILNIVTGADNPLFSTPPPLSPSSSSYPWKQQASTTRTRRRSWDSVPTVEENTNGHCVLLHSTLVTLHYIGVSWSRLNPAVAALWPTAQAGVSQVISDRVPNKSDRFTAWKPNFVLDWNIHFNFVKLKLSEMFTYNRVESLHSRRPGSQPILCCPASNGALTGA